MAMAAPAAPCGRACGRRRGVRGQAALGGLFLRLQLRLASGVALDYEGKRSNRFTVQVTDGADQNGAQDRQRR